MTKIFVYHEHNDSNAFGEMITRVFPSAKEAEEHLKTRLSAYFNRPVNDVKDLKDLFKEEDSLDPEYVSFDTGNGVCFWTIEEHAYENTAPEAGLAFASVSTSMGKLIATVGGEEEYPGIEISIQPEGEQPVVLALAEVVEAGYDCDGEAHFHLRPYIGKYPNQADENGVQITGKISCDAPMDDIVITPEDMKKYFDMFKKPEQPEKHVDPELCRQLYELAEAIAGDAPDESECTDAENEFFAECANIVNCYPDFAADQEKEKKK